MGSGVLESALATVTDLETQKGMEGSAVGRFAKIQIELEGIRLAVLHCLVRLVAVATVAGRWQEDRLY